VKCRCPQWTKDEKVCARNVNNEMLFYEDNNFSKVLSYVFWCIRVPYLLMYYIVYKSTIFTDVPYCHTPQPSLLHGESKKLHPFRYSAAPTRLSFCHVAPCGLRELWFFVRIGPIRFLAGCHKRRLNQS